MGFTSKPFSEQVAIVTGGGTGIGRAFAEALAAAGAKVIIASRREEVLRRAAAEMNTALNAERVFPYLFDIRDRAKIEELVSDVFERWQSIDLLINNAGLAVPETVDAITEDGWDKVMDTNLRGVMQLVRAVLPHMRANDFGDIVNVSSQAGKHGYADVPSYCASKFGLLGYAEALRDDVRKTGANIRIFNFCPGLVEVENIRPDQIPREGFIHVSNMARTLMYALSLDRNVVLEDISLYAK
ncbi:MAG TPA: short-chain dehydrogenase [Blastocatellia bacterium]|jgi:NADP-dependent 3-hydroxy acid dehydrogenase YdfG|nr:short-chain dehydrogenase [Blastocatellia bacterium]HAF22356.1 short-chain dehydrogenase [Blastocatellia bacterium]HCX28732.1 short-chain dehydrogenase [Blastocatellia bacterium]